VASACGFRGPYSCGAAGEFPERLKDKGIKDEFSFILRLLPLSFTKSPLSRNPSAADYRSSITSSTRSFVVCSINKSKPCLSLARSRKRKTKHDSSQRAVASSVYRGKTERPFSLFRRGRLKNALGRFPGLGFNLLATPSRPSTNLGTVTCVAAFVAITVAGPRRIFTGLP
jgi:hypothetical protein